MMSIGKSIKYGVPYNGCTIFQELIHVHCDGFEKFDFQISLFESKNIENNAEKTSRLNSKYF